MAETYVKIKDTGKAYLGESAAANEVIAKGDDGAAGSYLTLKGIEIDFSTSTLTADTPTPGLKTGSVTDTNYDYQAWRQGDVDQVGVSNPIWKIKGFFMLNSETDMKAFGRLIFFTKTKGYKELTSQGSSISDYAMPLINYSQYDHGSTTTIASLNVRLTGLTCKFGLDAKGFNKVDYTLTLMEIGSRGNP